MISASDVWLCFAIFLALDIAWGWIEIKKAGDRVKRDVLISKYVYGVICIFGFSVALTLLTLS